MAGRKSEKNAEDLPEKRRIVLLGFIERSDSIPATSRTMYQVTGVRQEIDRAYEYEDDSLIHCLDI